MTGFRGQYSANMEMVSPVFLKRGENVNTNEINYLRGIHRAGRCQPGHGGMGSIAQMVADNKIAVTILRMRKSIPMDTDALAVDVIASVMGNSRNFLGQKHTMKFLKSGETFMTRSAERGSWESWLSSGKSGLVERAQVEAERFLRE